MKKSLRKAMAWLLMAVLTTVGTPFNAALSDTTISSGEVQIGASPKAAGSAFFYRNLEAADEERAEVALSYQKNQTVCAVPGIDACGFAAPEGRAFKEWNTKRDGSGRACAPGDTVQVKKGDAFYAIWTAQASAPENSAPTVTYWLNGASVTESAVASEDGYMITVKTPEELGLAVPEGQRFTGWSGTGGSAFDSGVAIFLGADLVLTAGLAAAPVVRFKANWAAGTYSGSQPADVLRHAAFAGGSYVFTAPSAEELGFSARGERYLFAGWSDLASGRGDNYVAGSQITLDGSGEVTYYAIWVDTQAAETETASFYIRLDGTMPHEPSYYPASQYSGGIAIAGALRQLAAVNNSISAVYSNLAKMPTDAQIKGVVNGYDPSVQEVVWYVIKYDASDGWHVDGVLRDKNAYSVNYHANGGVENTMPATVKYAQGQTVQVRFSFQDQNGATVRPTRYGYTFVGWSASPSGTALYREGGAETFVMPDRDVDLYAVWRKRTDVPYAVEHYLQQSGGYLLEARREAFGTLGEAVSIAACVENFDGFAFVRSDPEGETAEITVDDEGNGNLVIKLYYDAPAYSVTYRYLNSVPGASALPVRVSYMEGTEVTVAPNATAPNHTFSGWSTADAEIIGGKLTMPDHNVTIIGSFLPRQSTLTVEHYLENLDGSYPTEPNERETPEATTGSLVTPSNYQKPFTGFAYDHSDPAGEVTVSGDGTTVLKLYYTRESHSVSYRYEGFVPTGAEAAPATQSYGYGANVAVEAEPAQVPGYAFSGWAIETPAGLTVTNGSFAMPEEDVTLVGSFTATNVFLTVEHYLENLDGSYPTEPNERETPEATTGSSVTPSDYQKPFTGFAYDHSDPAGEATVSGDGTTVLKLYYARESHSISYRYEGDVPTGATPAPTAQNHAYGANVAVEAEPARVPGYAFSGWAIETPAGLTVTNGSFAMPAGDVTLVGSFTHKRFHVLYQYDGTEPAGAMPPVDANTYFYGDSVTALEPAKQTGFLFLGWTTADAALSGNGTLIMPEKDVTLVGSWISLAGWSVDAIDEVYDGAPYALHLTAPGKPSGCVAEKSADGVNWTPLSDEYVDATDVQRVTVRVTLAGATIWTAETTVRIAKRPIQIPLPTDSRTYNGAYQTLTVDASAIGAALAYDAANPDRNLAPGQTLDAIRLSAYWEDGQERAQNIRKNTGRWPVSGISATILANGQDVTANYDVTILDGTFTITARQGLVTVGEKHVLYSGAGQSFNAAVRVEGVNGADLSGNVGLSYRFEGRDYASLAQVPLPADAGEYLLTVLVNDPSGNYTFDPDGYPSLLKIYPIPVVLTPESVTAVYDGAAKGCVAFTAEPDGDTVSVNGNGVLNPGLLAGHAVTGYTPVNNERVDAGVYPDAGMADAVILDAGGSAVTRNYQIRYATGTITIEKRPLRVLVSNASKVYDGLSLTVGMGADAKLDAVNLGLAPGHTLSGTLTGNTITDVGSSVSTVDTLVVSDGAGEEVTRNYRLTTVDGSVTIEPRPIRVIAGTASRVYDGTPLDVPGQVDPSMDMDNLGLAPGHAAAITLAGGGRVNAGASAVSVSAFQVLDAQGREVTANYIPSYVDGSVTVTPRPIRLMIGSAQKAYDGRPLNVGWAVDAALDNANAGAVPGETVQASLNDASRTNVGSNAVTLGAFSVTNSRGEATTGNYALTVVDGRLVITPATASYTIRYYYDGELDPGATETGSGVIGGLVSGYPSKVRPGMRLDSVTGMPLALSADAGSNVISVYYVSRPRTVLITELETPLAGSMAGANVGDCIE